VELEQIAWGAEPEAWSRLATATGSPFGTREFALAWWESFGAERQPFVIACRHAGELLGLLPLVIQRVGPLRVARLIGTGPGDQLQPLCAPGDRQAVAAGLTEALRVRMLPCDVLLLERLPPAWAALLPGQELKREASPVIVAPGGGWEGYLAERSANFRAQVRRQERRLARDHALAFRLADAETLDADLTTLLELHDARWAGGGSGTLSGRWAAFHRSFARAALDCGWLRLWTLELDGRPAASWYGFRFGDAEWYYQSGRDPALGDLSVGAVLLAGTIRAAFDDGVVSYQLLRGDEVYKRRYATADQTLTSTALAASARGTMALTLARQAVRTSGPTRAGMIRRLA
jgi:CelD/BcsL family acetyltransferase involved in cellulose biosynthesis